jgi:Beta-galactosidase trimerisation domain
VHSIGGENGLGEDRRFEQIGFDYFSWTAKHDRHFANKQSIASIGVVIGQRTQLFYKTPHDVRMPEYMDGMYYALIEGRFLFDFVHEERMELERLKKYSALILPNTALLSDAQCEQLRAYVRQGGSLLATFESSMYNEHNQRRPDFGLADVFGIHAAGGVIGRVGNSNPFYARIEKQHPILEGFGNTRILPGAEYRVPLAPVDGPVLTVVPGFPAYPPELSYPPQPHTNEPAIVVRENGNARLVFFPGDVERTMWLSGNTDLSRLLQNAIRWVAGESTPVTITGRGLIEAFAWETEPGFAVHVLNYTNPNVHRGWVREFYPIGEQKVRMKVPPGRKVQRVELLRAGKDIPFRSVNGSVEFIVPSVEDYEVAALYA